MPCIHGKMDAFCTKFHVSPFGKLVFPKSEKQKKIFIWNPFTIVFDTHVYASVCWYVVVCTYVCMCIRVCVCMCLCVFV